MSEEMRRLRAGVEGAIEVSTEYLDEAFDKVPLEQWHYYTYNLRQMLYAQLRFYQALGGIGLPLYKERSQPKPKSVNLARLKL